MLVEASESLRCFLDCKYVADSFTFTLSALRSYSDPRGSRVHRMQVFPSIRIVDLFVFERQYCLCTRFKFHSIVNRDKITSTRLFGLAMVKPPPTILLFFSLKSSCVAVIDSL